MNNIKTLITLFACFVSITSAASQGDATTVRADVSYTTISTGDYHTVALKSDGSLWTWGSNSYGQLGDGTTTIRSLVPKQIGTGYSAISAGSYHTVALKSDGSLWAWGDNNYYYGQLGDGSFTRSLVPKQIGTGYTAIAAGDNHTVALKADGSLWDWGDNQFGQLGDDTTTSRRFPKQIGTGYAAIAAGSYHTIALKSDGSLWAWGANDYGQLGYGTTITRSLVPKQIGTDSYTAVSAGWGHSIALKADGSLWAWGNNHHGQLGDGTTTLSFVPKQIGTAPYATIAAGALYTIALKADGSLWAWGDNSDGQLGYATTTRSLLPKQIGTDSYTEITAGQHHTFALKSDGSLWAWGNNQYGQLGDGTATNSLIPKQITNTGQIPETPDNTAPTVPARLTVTPITSTDVTQVKLFWTPSTDNMDANKYIDYIIYRDGVLLGQTVDNYFYDSGMWSARPPAPPRIPISIYTVSACDFYGNCSAQSAVASVTSGAQAPPGVTGLTATPISATQIDLVWTSSTDNIGGSQYEIYRNFYTDCAHSSQPQGIYPGVIVNCAFNDIRLLTTLSGNPQQTSYSDAGLSPSAYYTYTVRVCDAVDGCSAENASASTHTPTLPITPRTPPTATGTFYGPLTNQTIRVVMTPPENIANLDPTTRIFMAAVVPPSLGSGTYFKVGTGEWLPYTTCNATPVTSVWGLSPTHQLDVVPTPTDLTSLKGTMIYVGYGIGVTDAEACANMLDNSNFTLAYTIN